MDPETLETTTDAEDAADESYEANTPDQGEFMDEALAFNPHGAASVSVPPQTPSGLPTIPQAIQSEFAAGQGQAIAQGDVGSAEANKREHETSALADRSAQQGLDALDREDQQLEYETALTKAQQAQHEAEQSVKDFKYQDFWADKSTGQKALAVLFSAISGSASVYAKQPNMALQAITAAEEADTRRQQLTLMKMERFAQYKKEGVKDIEDQFVRDNARLINNQSLRLKAMADYARAQYLRSGATPEEAQNNVLVNGLLAKSETTRRQALIEYYKAETARIAKAKKASGGGSVSGSLEALSAFKNAHPDDQVGLYALAEKLGLRGKAALPIVKQVNDMYETREKTMVRDEQGNAIGTVPTGRGGAAQFAQRDADFKTAQEQLEALLADVKQHGDRVVDPDKVKRRNALYQNAIGGVAVVSPLGKTNEAIEIEKGAIGNSGAVGGHGVLDAVTSVAVGANPKAIERKIEEIKDKRARYREQTLRPIEGRSAPKESAPAKPSPISKTGSRPSLDSFSSKYNL